SLGKHLQHRRDQFRAIQATKSHKDSARETVQIISKHASAAVRTEVAIKPLAGFSDIVERLRLAAEEREIIFWHTKESRRRATGGPFAVVAMAGRDKRRICIELELYCTRGALCRIFLLMSFTSRIVCKTISTPSYASATPVLAAGPGYFAFLFRVFKRRGGQREPFHLFLLIPASFADIGPSPNSPP